MKGSLHQGLATVLAGLMTAALAGCSCGFDCSGSNNSNNGGSNSALLTLGFSDSLPEDLSEVVITVDAIIFRRSGVDDVKVERFTIDQLGIANAESFPVNLLDYRGTDQLLVIENRALEPGLYDEVFINVLDGNANRSYVIEPGGSQQELNVPGSRLVLKGMELSTGPQTFTVEFGLAQSLQFDTTSGYLLTANGIRIEDNEVDAQLNGQVDSGLFGTVFPCNEKVDPETGNRVYLYQGHLSGTALADVFLDESEQVPEAGTFAPFAVASLAFNDDSNNWEYAFGYLPPGNYTLAFSCDTGDDDSVQWDELTIPLPEDQVYRLALAEGDSAQCNLSTDTGSNPGDCTR